MSDTVVHREPLTDSTATWTPFFNGVPSSLLDTLSHHDVPAEGIAAVDEEGLGRLNGEKREAIVNLQPLNDVRDINCFLEAVNEKLRVGGVFIGCVETAAARRSRIFTRYASPVAWSVYIADFLFRRVSPKIRLTRPAYFAITKGRNQAITRPETLGRLIACGFDLNSLYELEGLLYFVVTKARHPEYDRKALYGPIFKMRRIGLNGRPIYVYKLRTMHPYSEYLQQYVHDANSLDANGKFKNDFRIASWGRFFRKIWLDELPMLINWVKGDVKLVGVRPLSEHYLSLYPTELAERRIRVKPGLIPPFYADLPRNFEEILQSERQYLDSYDKQPIRTQIRYFSRAVYNILFLKARSQ